MSDKAQAEDRRAQIQAEEIVREHGSTDCRGQFVPELPFCSCAPEGHPLCDSCRKLRDVIAAELLRLSRERDEAVAKSHIDETGYNEMRDTAAQLAQEVDRLSRVEQALREALEVYYDTEKLAKDASEAANAGLYLASAVRVALSASPEAQPEEQR